MSSFSQYLLHPSRMSAFSYADLRGTREQDEMSICDGSESHIVNHSQLEEKIKTEAGEFENSGDERPNSTKTENKIELSSFEITTTKQNDQIGAKSKNSKEDDRNSETFVAVIAQAVLSVPTKRMTLSSIYSYIARNYPHFDTEKGPGWRNSVRHNLSSNDCFVKASRAENGKGHYWMIHPKDLPEFSKGNFRRRRKPRRPKCSHSFLFRDNPFLYHTFTTAGLASYQYQHMRTSEDLAEISLPLPYGTASERSSLTQATVRPTFGLLGNFDESRPRGFAYPRAGSFRFGAEYNHSGGYSNLTSFPGVYQHPCGCHR